MVPLACLVLALVASSTAAVAAAAAASIVEGEGHPDDVPADGTHRRDRERRYEQGATTTTTTTRRPTRRPTRKPTKRPTRRPTKRPTRRPSPKPTTTPCNLRVDSKAWLQPLFCATLYTREPLMDPRGLHIGANDEILLVERGKSRVVRLDDDGTK